MNKNKAPDAGTTGALDTVGLDDGLKVVLDVIPVGGSHEVFDHFFDSYVIDYFSDSCWRNLTVCLETFYHFRVRDCSFLADPFG